MASSSRARVLLAFLIALFTLGVGCGPIPAPKPPALRDIAVVVTDQGQSLPSAVVTLGTLTQATGPDGVVTFHFIPAASQTLSVTVSYPGCQPYTQMATLAASINQQIDVGGRQTEETAILLPPLNCHVDPSTFSLERLAQIRGAMWPSASRCAPSLFLPFGPRPGQPDNIIATVFFANYSAEDQDAIVGCLRGLGYTHVVMGPLVDSDGYHGQFQPHDWTQDFDRFLDTVQFFWDAGLAPVVFLHPDNWTFEETRDRLTPLLAQPRAQKLLRIVVPAGWEPTRYGWSSCTWALFGQWARQTLPNALVLLHTTTDVDAPAGTDARCNDDDHSWNPTGNAGAWTRVAPSFHGWLIQNGPYRQAPSDNPTLAANFAAQFQTTGNGVTQHSVAWHFVGNAGWPTSSAWGNTPIKLYAGETTSYSGYWENLPEAVRIAWGDLAMASGAAGCLDGCSAR